MKLIRRIWRAFLARWFPLSFARWVNRERCRVHIVNDPAGWWIVTIGVTEPVEGRGLGRTMLAAFREREADPEWEWTTDYLRGL